MIDFHCHILPGIDDGPVEIEQSLRMARQLAGAGYRKAYCTPHLIKGVYESSRSQVLHELGRLQQEINRQGIPLRLLSGREYFLDEYLRGYLEEPMVLEGTDFIMVEIPSHAPPGLVKDTLFWIVCKGLIPMIAHPERCALLQAPSSRDGLVRQLLARPFFNGRLQGDTASDANLLDYLLSIGCRFQENMGSRNGRYGAEVQSNARNLASAGIYTHLGTDAHDPDSLENMLAGYR